ncbi:hypothetical protein [uncultured Corynebacterium sp.]|uniref:hypothetical protein n=1 Tax=uncultured Corynebacterium sp. TaxID=159447 RepID=UPI0025DECA1E|nr:hypothetical protein [uncultured Corynebacterium sp.]
MRGQRGNRPSWWREAVDDGRDFANSRSTFSPVKLLVCVAVAWIAVAAGVGVDDAVRFLPWMLVFAVPVMALIWVLAFCAMTVVALLLNPLLRTTEGRLGRRCRRHDR